MNENDKRFIEELFIRQTEQFQQHVVAVMESFDSKLAVVAEGHQMLSETLARVESRLTESFDHKLAVVAEGHRVLSETLERVESRLGEKIDKIAAEVAAHRADTEAHHGIYRVKES